jgi:hypothetical protein
MPSNNILAKGEVVITLTVIAPDKRKLTHRIGLLFLRIGAWLCKMPFTVQAESSLDSRMGVE